MSSQVQALKTIIHYDGKKFQYKFPPDSKMVYL